MLYSGATYRPLAPRQGQPPMRAHDIVCVHTMVGNLHSTDGFFHQNGWIGAESHFGVGGIWGPDLASGWDGKVFQWQDTTFTADANEAGNWRVISIETADNAPKTAEEIVAWTPAQCHAIAEIIAWACKTYSIPPVLIPDSKPGRRGIGFHRQGCEHSDGLGSHPGWLVAGGEQWGPLGKGCPGPVRIAQLSKTIIPMVISLLKGDEMTPADWVTLRQIMHEEMVNVLTQEKIVLNLPVHSGDPIAGNWTTAGVLAAGDKKADATLEQIGKLVAALPPASTEPAK